MSNPPLSKDWKSIKDALNRARDCDNGSIDAGDSIVLEASIAELWGRIKNQPDYVLTRDEFALFNYFRASPRYSGDPDAKRAVAQHWETANCDVAN